MKIFSQDQINDVSFPDAPVSEFKLDGIKRMLTFTTDAFVGSAPTGRWFDEAIVTIFDFEEVKIIEENSKIVQRFLPEFALRGICEFILTDGKLVMRGFSYGRGLWTEYCFVKPKIQIEYDEFS